MASNQQNSDWYQAWAREQTQAWAKFYFAPLAKKEEKPAASDFWQGWRDSLIEKITSSDTPWDDEKQQLIFKIIDEVQAFLGVVAELSQLIVGEFQSLDDWELQLRTGVKELQKKAKNILDEGLSQSQMSNMSWAWFGKSTDMFNESLGKFIPGVENIATIEHFVKTVANIEWFQPVNHDKMSHTITKYQHILRIQQAKIAEACLRTIDVFCDRLIAEVRNGAIIDNLDKLHQIYVEANDVAFNELINDADYLESSTQLCNEYIDLLLTQRKVTATMHRAADSATNDDLDKLIATVKDLREQLDIANSRMQEMQHKIDEIEKKHG